MNSVNIMNIMNIMNNMEIMNIMNIMKMLNIMGIVSSKSKLTSMPWFVPLGPCSLDNVNVLSKSRLFYSTAIISLNFHQ